MRAYVKLSAAGSALALAVSLIAGSSAVAASAAHHKPQWAFEGGNAMMLNGREHSVTITPADKQIVDVPYMPRPQTAYKSYRLVVKTSSGRLVLENVGSAYRTQFLLNLLTKGAMETTKPGPLISGWQRYTTSSLKKVVKWARSLSLKAIRAKDRDWQWEYSREDVAQYSVAGDIYDSIIAWKKKNPRAQLSEYPHPLIGFCSDTWKYRVSGTLDRFTVKAYPRTDRDIWVALSNRTLDGEVVPVPSASADSYSTTSYLRWVKRENITEMPPVVAIHMHGDCPAA